MTRHHLALLSAAALGACSAAPEAEPWRELFDGRTLTGWASTAFGGEGEVHVVDGGLVLEQGSPLTGVTWAGEPPTGDYELEVVASRLLGSDFFCGLTFPVGDAHLTLVLGGWGGAVCGLSCLDGLDAAQNETRRTRSFPLGRDVTARLVVRRDAVEVFLDRARLLAVDLRGRAMSLRPEVALSRPLGIATFATVGRISALRWRPLPPLDAKPR
jgi:hypothetical protein